MRVKDFWDAQAQNYSASSLATSPDSIAFELEVSEILRHLKAGESVADFGCGNGVKAAKITEKIAVDYHGFDFSGAMIAAANELKRGLLRQNGAKSSFKVGDILDAGLLKNGAYDKVITDRCLINLSGLDAQTTAIRHIFAALKPGGHYICLENTTDALKNLNSERAKFALPPISVRWHNCYFKESELLFAAKEAGFLLASAHNFASTYYLISRTLNAVLFDGDYNSALNQMAAKLPPLGDFSPVKCFLFVKGA